MKIRLSRPLLIVPALMLAAVASAAVLVGSGGTVELAGQTATAGEQTSSSGARVLLTGPAYTLPGPSSSGATLLPVIVAPAGEIPPPIQMDGFLVR